MLIILACLTGVLLGLTLNVFVLFPVTIAGALAYLFLSQGLRAWSSHTDPGDLFAGGLYDR